MSRQIEKTKAFRKDWKRVTSGVGVKVVEKFTSLMITLTDRLAADDVLEPK
jgi:hypothetical protein